MFQPATHFAPEPGRLARVAAAGAPTMVSVTALAGVPGLVRRAFGEAVLAQANRAAMLDIELIEHIKREVLPAQRAAYGPDLEGDVRTFKESLGRAQPPKLYPYLDYAIRKLYYEPLTGFIRVLNGKRYRGSY